MSNFHPLEVVGRGSETQLQVGENLNSIICALMDDTYRPKLKWKSYALS